MRTWFNGILQFIGATTLTDLEWDSLNLTSIEINLYNQAAYDQLAIVLIARESVSVLHDRLVALFKAKGTEVQAKSVGKSTILVGSVLE